MAEHPSMTHRLRVVPDPEPTEIPWRIHKRLLARKDQIIAERDAEIATLRETIRRHHVKGF